MAVVVSRNTIKLTPEASSVANYYVGCEVVVSRLFLSGEERIARKKISAYDGATKIATIEGLWESDFIPGHYLPTASIANKIARNDTFEVVPAFKDSRVSTNTAIQAMDYITSNRYGRGLDPIKDLDLPSWLQAGRDCDAQSDVTVETTATLPAVGDVYRYTSPGGKFIWQGKVSQVFTATILGVAGKKFIRFTEVIGKLTNKWNSWKSLIEGSIVYHEDRVYRSAGGTRATAPVHTSGTGTTPSGQAAFTYITTMSITKVSGSGPTTLTLPCTGKPANPVRSTLGGTYSSGYSLYDADGIDYWRYQGWDEHDQRYATRHQTNLMIDTSLPLFDNMNSLLEHFGGILRYNAGKYYLETEKADAGIADHPAEPRNINADYIIGRIKISDDGIRSAYNSLTVAYADPANKFEARNISFFNAKYLKEDRNVPRKGNLSIPGITNYYNARLMADKYLTESRYNLTISFNMAPRGALLLSGRVIQLSYPRYGWDKKKFRIENLSHNRDCSVDIVATEYDDDFYVVQPIRRQPGTGLAGESKLTTMGPPTNLFATNGSNEGIGGVELIWTNDPVANASHVTTEVFSSYSSKLYITTTGYSAGVFTSSLHELKDGQIITVKNTVVDGPGEGKSYYVRDVTANTFKLAATKGGTPLTFTAGSGVRFLTATVIANVPAPENTYFDAFISGDASQTTKYYWVRYKVTQ